MDTHHTPYSLNYRTMFYSTTAHYGTLQGDMKYKSAGTDVSIVEQSRMNPKRVLVQAQDGSNMLAWVDLDELETNQ